MTEVAERRAGVRRSDLASRAALLSVSSNAVLMVLKVSVGMMFGSVAVLGDGVDSAEDLFASGLALITVRMALQPADEGHPYGHGKAESLAAMSQGALIAGGAVFIALTAVRRFISHDAPVQVLPSLIMMLVTAVVNLGVAAYSLRAAKESGSVAIASDARHLLTNVVQAGAIMAGLGLVGVTGNRVFDPITALLLALYLAWAALGIFRVALSELIDTALPAATVASIQACFEGKGNGVRGYHALRTRKSGRETHIDVHALVDPSISVSEAHRLVEALEAEISALIPGAMVSVHVDPDEPDVMTRDPADGTPDHSLNLHG